MTTSFATGTVPVLVLRVPPPRKTLIPRQTRMVGHLKERRGWKEEGLCEWSVQA